MTDASGGFAQRRSLAGRCSESGIRSAKAVRNKRFPSSSAPTHQPGILNQGPEFQLEDAQSQSHDLLYAPV